MKFSSHLLVRNNFIQIFILLLADYLCAQSWMNVTVSVGSTAVLPCDWKNASISEWRDSSKIVWLTGSGVVFERSGTILCRAHMYDDRVNIPEDKLFGGNCSLILRNITYKDEGLYESSAVVQNAMSGFKSVPIQKVNLMVNGVEIKDKNNSANCENPPVCPDSGYYMTIIIVLSIACLLLLFTVVYMLCREKGKCCSNTGSSGNEGGWVRLPFLGCVSEH